MIDENLEIKSADLNHRNCAGYYFARWFDEPFTVEMLRLLTDREYLMGDDDMDRLHCDFTYEEDGRRICCDSKTVTRNFCRPGTRDYNDVVTVGEYVLKGAGRPDIITFFYRQRIYMVPGGSFVTPVQPYSISESEGENFHKQRLFHYRVSDIINAAETSSYVVPENFSDLYESAYVILERTRNFMNEMTRSRNRDFIEFQKASRRQALERMSKDLKLIISTFNAELRKSDRKFIVDVSVPIETNLLDIYNLIS